MNKVLPKSELDNCDSDFLCSSCHELLYFNVTTKKEICANPSCKMFPPKLSFHTVSNSPAEIDLKEKLIKIIKELKSFSKEFFYSYLHEKRTITCEGLFTANRLRLNYLLGIDYLLISLSKNESWGTSHDSKQIEIIFIQFIEEFSNLIFVEDISSGNFLMGKDGQVFALKFLNQLIDLFKTLGIADESQIDMDKVDSFYFIEKQAKVGAVSNSFDFATIYQNHFPLVIVLNHVFQLRYFIAKYHKYTGKTADFAALLSLWALTKPQTIERIDEVNLKDIFYGTQQKNSLLGSFDEFKKEYSSGEQLAPILTFDGKWYRFDYVSLLIFLLYLFSLNKKIDGTQTLPGSQTLDDQRQKASNTFEKVIRDIFRKDGYAVYPQKDNEKFIRTFNGQTHEFDCIAVNESKKIIVIIDAKYEDISPSSKAAINLVNQEILDENTGIIQYTMTHEKRTEFVIKNFDKLHFDSKNPSDYTLISMIVTKHMTIIKKYKNIHILSYDQFTKYRFSA